MASYYFLVCMECRSGINLGKAVLTRYGPNQPENYGFSGLGYFEGAKWVPELDEVVNLDHFLMLHRGHELRVLPDTVQVHVTDGAFPDSWPDMDGDVDLNHDRTRFLQQVPRKPDADAELKTLSDDVIEKLSRF